MYCRSQNKIEQENMLLSYVKNNLMNKFTLLLKFSNTMILKKKIERVVEMLLFHFYYCS